MSSIDLQAKIASTLAEEQSKAADVARNLPEVSCVGNRIVNRRPTMSEDDSSPLVIQADHRFWKQEHAAWRNEIVLWQEEYDAMRAAIEALAQSVQRHGEVLRKHAAAINAHEAALDLHERVIAEHETGCERPGRDDIDIDRHQQQSFAHLDQRQTHERMKRDHHRLVAQLEMLDSILNR